MREAIEGAPKWLRLVLPVVLIFVWFGAGAIGGPYFGKIEEVADNGFVGFLPESAESTKVNEQLEKFRDDTTLPGIVVFYGDKNISEKTLKEIDAVAEVVAEIDGVGGDVSPAQLSDDKMAALVVVPLVSDSALDEVVPEVIKSYEDAGISGVDFRLTGPAGFAADLNKAFSGIDGILLLTALAVVFVILIVVYRSIFLPIIVLLTSIFALSASILVIWYLAKSDIVALNGQVQGILFILVIGAATDYSLLFVARYREALYENTSKLKAIAESYKGAFEPILASGGTVIVGLMCLLLSDLGSNKALAPVGSIGVAFAMLSALTFLPSMLYALGKWSFWPFVPSAKPEAAKKHKARLERGFWHKVGKFVEKYYRPTWIATTLVLAVFAVFSFQLKADGVEQSEFILGESTAREGQRQLNEHFPGGSGSPADVIVPEGEVAAALKVIEATEGTDSVVALATGVDAGIKPLGGYEEDIKAEIRNEVEKEYSNLSSFERQFAPPVDSVVNNAYPFKDAEIKVVDGLAVLQVTLTDEPDSQAAKDTIVALRENFDDVGGFELVGRPYEGKGEVLVGGPTAIQYDTIVASQRDRAVIIPTVLVAITIILMLLLRSIVAPILLLASTVLSFATTLGIAAILFNNVFDFPGADPTVILFGFVFLVALGIDYNIFLMTRVREESIKSGTQKGVIKGLVVTGGVITSAGIVLAATFAALGVIPILFLFQIAFIVAFGVLLDTFVVRSLLVPALIRDIGSFVWWPSKLKDKK